MLASMGGNESMEPLLDKCLAVVHELGLQADVISGEHRARLDAQRAEIEEQERQARMADPLAHVESEDTDIDAEQIDALRKEVLKYTDQVVEEARQKLSMKIVESGDALERRCEKVAQKQAGQDEMIRQLANYVNDHLDKGNEVTQTKQAETALHVKKAQAAVVQLQKDLAELTASHTLTREVMRTLVSETESAIGGLLQHADSAAALGSARSSQKSGLSLHVPTTNHPTLNTKRQDSLATKLNTTMSIQQSRNALIEKNVQAIPAREASIDLGDKPRNPKLKHAQTLLKRSQYAMLKLAGHQIRTSSATKVPDRLRFIHNQNEKARRMAASAMATEIEKKMQLSKRNAQ